MRRCGRVFGCVAAVAASGCSLHVWGRYDCRSGAVQEQRDGGNLVQQLLDEAAKELKSDGTSKD